LYNKKVETSGLWHTVSDLDVISKLGSSSTEGLSDQEVKERRKIYGENILPEIKHRSKIRILFSQFKNLPIIFLLIATILAYSLGRNLEAISIIVVVFITAGIGFVMENSSERTIRSLAKLGSPKAKVLRNGKEFQTNAHELVVGDIIEFEAGDRIPADCRLIESFGLIIDESPLTGESHGILKDSSLICSNDTELVERKNICYMGTLTQEGRGKAIVVNIGKQTEIGTIGSLLEKVTGGKTPFEKKIEQLGKKLVLVILSITLFYIVIGYFQHFPIGSLFLSGIVLAIAAVPEGLPAIATITLALGVKRMAKKNALVRKLASAETLGSITIICTDKTGTLTLNEPTVKQIILGDGTILQTTGFGFNPSGKIYKGITPPNEKNMNDYLQKTEDKNQLLLFQTITLCNNSELYFDGIHWKINGDTTEGALIVASEKMGFKKRDLEKEYPRIWEEPFDSKTRRMITVHRKKNKLLICIKGAPEEVFPLCKRIMEKDEVIVLDEEKKKKLNEKIIDITLQGYRSLLIAFMEVESDIGKINYNYKFILQNEAILLGIVALYDSVRPGVLNAIDFIKKSKIKIMMITGDHPLTAKAIAKELGIWNNDNNVPDEFMMITGKELEKLSVDKLAEKVERIRVFARTTPEYKLKIVEALQRKGHIVAMTGDGINDSPALKQADIGVAMGEKGTDVAKESAGLILLDDNFNTITHAIELGRLILFNIRKFAMFLLSCNLSEIMIMLLAIALSLPFPLLPLQLLLMNMVTDTFPALALAAEKGNRNELMLRLPSKNEPVISRKEWYSIFIQSLFMTIGTIGIFLWALNTDEERNVAQTLVFATIGMTQILHVLNYSSLLRRFVDNNHRINKYLIGAILLSLGILFIAVDVEPLNNIFALHRLNLSEWLISLFVSSLSVFGASLTIRIFNSKIPFLKSLK